MIKTVECRPDLPEQAYTFGAVLAKLTKPVIPAIREPVHLSRQRIRAGQGTVAIADICARTRQLAAEPGKRRDQVIEHLAGQVKISTHRHPLPRLRDQIITQDSRPG